MCLQVLFLGPALPSTFDLISEKLVVSPVLRTLTLKVRRSRACGGKEGWVSRPLPPSTPCGLSKPPLLCATRRMRNRLALCCLKSGDASTRPKFVLLMLVFRVRIAWVVARTRRTTMRPLLLELGAD